MPNNEFTTEKQIGKYCVGIESSLHWGNVTIDFSVGDNLNAKATREYTYATWAMEAYEKLKTEEGVTQFLLTQNHVFHTAFYQGPTKTAK
ncbi:Uncharacterised protein [uncultured archaeon]|nr:Uncharacterised protein [uncultured archaeon]